MMSETIVATAAELDGLLGQAAALRAEDPELLVVLHLIDPVELNLGDVNRAALAAEISVDEVRIRGLKYADVAIEIQPRST